MQDSSRQCLLLTSKVVLGSTTWSTTVSCRAVLKICTTNPKRFVDSSAIKSISFLFFPMCYKYTIHALKFLIMQKVV